MDQNTHRRETAQRITDRPKEERPLTIGDSRTLLSKTDKRPLSPNDMGSPDASR